MTGIAQRWHKISPGTGCPDRGERDGKIPRHLRRNVDGREGGVRKNAAHCPDRLRWVAAPEAHDARKDDVVNKTSARPELQAQTMRPRSDERRVGTACRYRW